MLHILLFFSDAGLERNFCRQVQVEVTIGSIITPVEYVFDVGRQLDHLVDLKIQTCHQETGFKIFCRDWDIVANIFRAQIGEVIAAGKDFSLFGNVKNSKTRKGRLGEKIMADAKVIQVRRPPLQITDWEVGVNLTKEGGWSRRHVEKVIRQHKLQHGEAYVAFNNSRMFGGSGTQPPKCRIYWNWNEVGLTCIPAVDESDQVSYQLLLNRWLHQSFGTKLTNIDEVFTDFQKIYDERELRRRIAARAAEKLKSA